MNDCTLSNDTAAGGNGRQAGASSGSDGDVGQGGGIYVAAGGAVFVTDCTLSGNSAQGGKGGSSDLGVHAGLAGFGGNAEGGAIYVAAGGTATLNSSTLSGNTAQGGQPGVGGGGSGDVGAGSGGGLSNNGTAGMANTIVAGNQVSGFYNSLTPPQAPDVQGTIASQGYNLVGATDGSSGWVGTDLTGTAAAPRDPGLAALGDYGGPTPTMALLPGSPALDAGSNALIPAGLATDQRGFARVSGAAVDIGAFEVQAPILSPATLPDGTYGTAYTSLPLTVAEEPGGAGGPYAFAVTAGALPAGLSLDGTDGALSGTPTAVGSVSFTVTATDSAGFTGSQSYTLTVKPAPLSATAVNFSATAGAPFGGTVATFTNADPYGTAASYAATITWGDGSTSAGTVSGTGSTLTVTGSHTYADPKTYAVGVQISNPNTTTAQLTDTATVSSLGLGVAKGMTGGIGFWHNSNGQALINSFNGGSTSTALANWLAASFPNLYGSGAGGNDLAGKSNAQVAAFYQSQFNLGGSKAQAQTLAVALNVYATTSSLGGSAGAAYGFTVSGTGLGARSYSVGQDGAAFGVSNNTTLNVYELLVAVNKKAVKGLLYNGDATLQAECADLFNALNQAGSI
jgi:hypothetical protein